jgi:pyruvate kinase
VTGRTKIVATIGPASDTPEVLDELLRAGVDVVRLNLSHGPIEQHLVRLQAVRDAAARTGLLVAVLGDLPGPKIRSGKFPDEGTFWAEGDIVQLQVGNDPSTSTLVNVEYPTLLEDVQPGEHCVIGDGAISLMVTAIADRKVNCVVVSGGRVAGRPGVHLPSEHSQLATPTAQDLELAVQMTAVGVDFLALSFVRHGADIVRLRAAVGDDGPLIVAKIETAAAIESLDGILEEADAMMVARGDLGIDCPLEDVPHLQKRIIRTCVERGVPVITATQMLESMITSPAPTRAEVSDIANAVFDGTDAIMLSAETAIGHDPALVVRTMARIAERAEADAAYRQWANRLGRLQRERETEFVDRITYAITHAAYQAATDIGVSAILCCTRSGRTALAMASFRPEATMIGLSPSLKTVKAMALSWGVVPLLANVYTSTDEMVWFAEESALAARQITHGDTVLVLAGAPDRSTGASTDVLRVVSVA